MSVSDKLITDEITQAISLLDGVLLRLQAMTQPAPVAEPTAIDKFLEPATSKPVTLEDVRHALTTLAGAHGAAAPKKLLAAYNAKKLSELDPIHFTAIFMAANAEALGDD